MPKLLSRLFEARLITASNEARRDKYIASCHKTWAGHGPESCTTRYNKDSRYVLIRLHWPRLLLRVLQFS